MNLGTAGAGTDSAYSSPTGKDTDSAFQLALGDAPAISPPRSLPSDRSAAELPVAAATPPISNARPRPPSAGQPSCHTPELALKVLDCVESQRASS